MARFHGKKVACQYRQKQKNLEYGLDVAILLPTDIFKNIGNQHPGQY